MTNSIPVVVGFQISNLCSPGWYWRLSYSADKFKAMYPYHGLTVTVSSLNGPYKTKIGVVAAARRWLKRMKSIAAYTEAIDIGYRVEHEGVTKTINEAREAVGTINSAALKIDSGDGVGDYYERHRFEASAIYDLIGAGQWDPEALRFLKDQLESARYVGD